ncbi:NAD(P)-dependent oxidoreductase [Kribbella sp. ALI-6-A]|uniref:SDR family oxidoreductase n=1 Tax=Kribbella sp. ALI-6-A TaxID=1933817 RepID=UPI00097BDCD2|nr:SDR family oxidoreductase [Kribbella sp. ALI-6-A]ONI68120.1 NAD(P)-dependent oxidoreductase [Kribbella sp. ALI-6-A]
MSIVVTGSTGALGRLVVQDLLAAGVPAGDIIAVARSKEKAADLAEQGVQVAIADYDQPESFDDVFDAGDRVLLISGSEPGRRIPQHQAVIDAAKKAGVAQLAYTGVFGGPKADFLLAADHHGTEQAILDSGLPYTFLRNNWYTEMYLNDLAGIAERGAVVNGVAPGSRIATATRDDYAAAAAVVLRTDGHLNQAYELSGDVAWTFDEFAAEVAAQTGKPVVHTSLSHDDNLALLVQVGLPEAFAAVLADVDDAISRGALAGTPGDLSRLTGRPTTPLADAIRAALS